MQYCFKSVLTTGDCLEKSLRFSWQDFGSDFAIAFFLRLRMEGLAQGQPARFVPNTSLELMVFCLLPRYLNHCTKLALSHMSFRKWLQRLVLPHLGDRAIVKDTCIMVDLLLVFCSSGWLGFHTYNCLFLCNPPTERLWSQKSENYKLPERIQCMIPKYT